MKLNVRIINFTLISILIIISYNSVFSMNINSPNSNYNIKNNDTNVSNCNNSTSKIIQSNQIIIVDNNERNYRITIPSSDKGTPLSVLFIFPGGGGSYSEFPQVSNFEQSSEINKMIIIYAISEKRSISEGEWFLNSASTSFSDINYVDTILDKLIENFCIDEAKIFATGYSLGSMFTYELACHLSYRFTGIASYAGSMPLFPIDCQYDFPINIMHIHGDSDSIINYNENWDWKEGEFENVGTMRSVSNLLSFWNTKYNCSNPINSIEINFELYDLGYCNNNVSVKHYKLISQDHEWPIFINSTYTSDIIIDFLISTSNKPLYSNTSVYNTSSSIVSTDVNSTNFETSSSESEVSAPFGLPFPWLTFIIGFSVFLRLRPKLS